MKSIDNINIVRSDSDGVSLSWIWPAETKCVRVVFLHKLSDTAPENMSFDELNRVSDLCFLNEFRSNNNMYNYKPHADDNGEAVFLLRGGDDLMYGFHLGAGRVMYHGSGLLKFLVHLRCSAVCADEHILAGARFICALYHAQPL